MFNRKRRRSDLDRQQEQFDQILIMFKRMLTIMSQADTKIQTLKDDVAKLTTVVASATTMIGGFQAQLAAAVQAALDAGATPAELQSLTDLHTAISAQSDGLAAAVAANTPAPAPAADPAAGGTPPAGADPTADPALTAAGATTAADPAAAAAGA